MTSDNKPLEESIDLQAGGRNVPKAFMVKSSHYFITGFALATAITWNTSVREMINQKFPIPEDNVRANFIFAIVITLILVIVIYILPDTKAELPDDTKKKIEMEEERHVLKKTLQAQQAKLREVEMRMQEMKRSMYGGYGSYGSYGSAGPAAPHYVNAAQLVRPR